MSKHVLNVGQCVPDHEAIRQRIEGNFDAVVHSAVGPDDALETLRGAKFDLVLVNRKLDADYSDGLEVIKRIKADPQLACTPVMLLTNYPEHDLLAVAAGAEPGFGKASLETEETRAKLSRFLN